jgi:hypothetical protein
MWEIGHIRPHWSDDPGINTITGLRSAHGDCFIQPGIVSRLLTVEDPVPDDDGCTVFALVWVTAQFVCHGDSDR